RQGTWLLSLSSRRNDGCPKRVKRTTRSRDTAVRGTLQDLAERRAHSHATQWTNFQLPQTPGQRIGQQPAERFDRGVVAFVGAWWAAFIHWARRVCGAAGLFH